MRLEDRRLLSTLVGVNGTELTIEDENSDQADQLSISVRDIGNTPYLIIQDAVNDVTSTTPGFINVGAHEVRVRFSDLNADGIDAIRIDTGAETDHVHFDLTQGAATFLQQFQTISLSIGDQPDEALSIEGDGQLDAAVQLSVAAGQASTSLTLSRPDGGGGTIMSQLSFVDHAPGASIELGQFDEVSVEDDQADTNARLSNGRDLADTRDTRVYASDNGTDSLDTLLLYQINSVSVTEGNGLDGDTAFVVDSGDNAAGISAWTIDTGAGSDTFEVNGDWIAASRISVGSGAIGINAGVTVDQG
ncbi:MAG: hypothetical protein KDA83_03095, partial [Planctomycetales bacterium]|nr:hypothetical protein [Planctomycetales bacterium]